MKKLLFLLIALITFLFQGQKPTFYEDIQHFKKLDTENPPVQNAILLIGSSSFTKWTDVANYFPTKTIINRGFGGSSLADLNYYADDLLKPYHPKQIVIYCGENDFAADKSLTPKQVFKRYKTFYKKIRSLYPKIKIDYISIKMSPSRKPLWPKFKATNSLIKNFMDRQKNAEYIDITQPMDDGGGGAKPSLFLGDMLHMKPEGYQIWAKEIAPFLE